MQAGIVQFEESHIAYFDIGDFVVGFRVYRVYGLAFTVLLMIALIPTSGLLCRNPQDPRNSLRNKVLMSMSGPVPRAQMYQVIPAQNTFWKEDLKKETSADS